MKEGIYDGDDDDDDNDDDDVDVDDDTDDDDEKVFMRNGIATERRHDSSIRQHEILIIA